ncbi:hypothetical protein [Nostoc sp.]|uniref:hypothetical protein n=1 Tax=Nostoc sp. TaxID=1180 RepID=UPI002FF4AB41
MTVIIITTYAGMVAQYYVTPLLQPQSIMVKLFILDVISRFIEFLRGSVRNLGVYTQYY